MIEIIPAILETDFAEVEKKVALVDGLTRHVQLDVCDGIFVPSKSWPYTAKEKTPTLLPPPGKVSFEIDFMTASVPLAGVDAWIAAGAKRFIFHVGSMPSMELAKAIVRANELVQCGLAIDLNTPTEALLPFLEEIAVVQFMGIEKVGYQGQEFAGERVLDKIRAFHGAHPEVPISVDGGVGLKNAKALVEAGASRLIVGSAIFGAKSAPQNSVTENIAAFKKAV